MKNEMLPPRSLYVHGAARRIELEIPDYPMGAGIIRMDLDACQNRDGATTPLTPPQTIQFFYPNYDPREFHLGDQVWVELEFYQGEMSLLTSKQRWFKVLNPNPDRYEYSAAGEFFFWPRASSGRRLYLDVGFPILLVATLPVFKSDGSVVEEGQFAHFPKGSLFGDVEFDSELQPARPK